MKRLVFTMPYYKSARHVRTEKLPMLAWLIIIVASVVGFILIQFT